MRGPSLFLIKFCFAKIFDALPICLFVKNAEAKIVVFHKNEVENYTILCHPPPDIVLILRIFYDFTHFNNRVLFMFLIFLCVLSSCVSEPAVIR